MVAKLPPTSSEALAKPTPTSPMRYRPPHAKRIQALARADAVPAKLLISGGIGTGKTTVLAAARDTLRSAGLTVLTRPPRADDPPDAALVDRRCPFAHRG